MAVGMAAKGASANGGHRSADDILAAFRNRVDRQIAGEPDPDAKQESGDGATFFLTTSAAVKRRAMSDDPPSALAAFLGEAPSAAALRRPSSSLPSQRQYARGTGEDSSPDTPGLPQQDGGVDECTEYNGATSAETDLLGTAALAPGKNRGTKARTAKPPKNTPDLKAPVSAGYAQVPGKRSGSKPPEVEDFSKTTTPMPEGAATMFGEDQPSAQRDHQKAANKTRPRSGSRMGNSASMCDLERTPPTSVPTAAVEYDPMGSSCGKRRFGGRG